VKAVFGFHDYAPPVSIDEATAHAMFEIAAGHELMPDNQQALQELCEKYAARST
jgi:hypothetical protein